VLYGGGEFSARLDMARAVVRRAEGHLAFVTVQCVPVKGEANAPVLQAVLPYINRLSDYFFALARYADAQGIN